MANKDEQTPGEPHRLTPDEVGARVGAILGDAEREAREIIAAARREGTGETVTLADLSHALERLSARFDAFELATAAQIEDLGRQLRGQLSQQGHAAMSVDEPVAPSPRASRVEAPALTAARVRAIDLALAGCSREVIANELASSLDRGEVEALLDDVLVN